MDKYCLTCAHWKQVKGMAMGLCALAWRAPSDPMEWQDPENGQQFGQLQYMQPFTPSGANCYNHEPAE